MNAEKEYSVITILEHLEVSLTALENYLPKFFQNTTQTYKSILNTNTFSKMTNKNPLSKPVKNSTREILMKNPVFELEYDFYYFVTRRIHLLSLMNN